MKKLMFILISCSLAFCLVGVFDIAPEKSHADVEAAWVPVSELPIKAKYWYSFSADKDYRASVTDDATIMLSPRFDGFCSLGERVSAKASPHVYWLLGSELSYKVSSDCKYAYAKKKNKKKKLKWRKTAKVKTKVLANLEKKKATVVLKFNKKSEVHRIAVLVR